MPISDGTIGLSIMTLANVRRKVGVVMGNLLFINDRRRAAEKDY